MKHILLLVLLSICLNVKGQQFLYIKKGNEFPVLRYAVSDRVKFRTAADLPWVSGIIREIGKDFIRINNVVYPLESIAAFRNRNELLTIGGTALWGGGVFFTGLALINGVINNDQPVIKSSQLVWGGGLVIAGLGMMALGKKDYYREDGWNWVSIDLSKDLDNG